MTTIIPIPAFADNYIWLLRSHTAAAVVDPGDATPVIAHFERERLELCAILTTHHHGDHVGGDRALLARWPVPVFGPVRETIPGRPHALAEGDVSTVPGIGLELSVLDIPGHIAGHIAYVARDAEAPARFLRRHVVCGGVRASVRGHAAAEGDVAGQARGLARTDAGLLRP